MQSFKEIQGQDSVKASRNTINDSMKTIMSNHSGTAFPTTNLQLGMKCYRSDAGKTYTLTNVANNTWVVDDHVDLAASANQLSTARTITLTGKVTGSVTFDGSKDVSLNVTKVTADTCTGAATSASSVAWGNITNKPSTFTPATHNHDSSYPSLSGSRATGTWGISITGSSASCTGNAKTATTATTANSVAWTGVTGKPTLAKVSSWNSSTGVLTLTST